MPETALFAGQPERCRSALPRSTADGAPGARKRRRASGAWRRVARLAPGLLPGLLTVACAAGTPQHGPAESSREDVDHVVRHLEVPTAPLERDALATIPSIRSDRVAIAVAVPPDLDPAQPHPILVTQVSADARSNVDALGAYVPAALEHGYVALTAEAMPWPAAGQDTILHRYATLRAGLRWLATEIPESERWPIVLAGFSGGAKISQVLAFSLGLEQRRVAGVFLGGCNEDHSALLLGQFPAMKSRFAQIAYYVSAGREDRIAPPASARAVADSLRAAGAWRVELSLHAGEHRLDARDASRALGWFRAQLR
jgi:predicted esterase